ncbi:unnamed protein product [Pleuronectes platessa]|uniref:ERO1-like protein beta n=1 Tax=Pleuronectes platessa TaxID=8262 RepID=A0A9N7YAN0_PLEPL|nr:unnamed protein product [Pleuronectes platessa]
MGVGVLCSDLSGCFRPTHSTQDYRGAGLRSGGGLCHGERAGLCGTMLRALWLLLTCLGLGGLLRSELTGVLDDCFCDVESIDVFNNFKIYPRIKKLTERDYFRYYRVNLRRPCPFWPDDGHCSIKDCHVEPCPESKIPIGIKSGNYNKVSVFKGRPPSDLRSAVRYQSVPPVSLGNVSIPTSHRTKGCT